MLENLSISAAFMLLVGAIVAMLGIITLVSGIKAKAGRTLKGTVMQSVHRENFDEDGQLIQFFYELQVRVKDGERLNSVKMRVPNEYVEGDEVEVASAYSKPRIAEETGGFTWLDGLLLIIVGAGIIATTLAASRSQNVAASIALTAAFAAAGAVALRVWLRERTEKLSELPAVIEHILYFRTSTPRKFIGMPKAYYPIFRYTLPDGGERHRISEISSSGAHTFKKGKSVTLYYDEKTGNVKEKKPSVTPLIIACALFFLAAFGLVGTFLPMK